MRKWTALLVASITVLIPPARGQQGEITLNEIFELAQKNNLLIKQAESSLLARQYALQAEKQSWLPKIDLLAGYNYLSKPLEINLQTVKDGILEGSSRQSVHTANEVFKEITGRDLSPTTQDLIYNGSRSILNTFYPDYNPTLSKQQYFTAALGLRQPIYLGNKLKTVQDVAAAEVRSGLINVELAGKQTELAIALQYIRILYLNSVLVHQQTIVQSLEKVEHDAIEMVKENILPPYQKNWMRTAVLVAKARYSNQQLEKKNALMEMNRLLDLPADSLLTITDTLQFSKTAIPSVQADFWDHHPAYRLINSKTDIAKATLQGSKSFSLPNVFAIGNLNLYQHDLPLTIPPWLVGVEMQWTIFNGTQTFKRVKASRQLVEESKLAAAQTRSLLQTGLQVAANKIKALENDVAALDSARVVSALTTYQVRERMRNRMATPREVNEALLMEEEIAKAYDTAVMGYYLALAEYLHLAGSARKITQYFTARSQ